MRRHAEGQSLVEMALLMPLLLIFLFAIIEFGYYIYSYATIFQAARNAAQVAAQAPPYQWSIGTIPPDRTDPCVAQILEAVEKGAVLFPDLQKSVKVSYPKYMRDKGGSFLVPSDRRIVGHPIEIEIIYEVEPLTPLWNLVPVLGNEGKMVVRTAARRTVESLGEDPSARNLSPCPSKKPGT